MRLLRILDCQNITPRRKVSTRGVRVCQSRTRWMSRTTLRAEFWSTKFLSRPLRFPARGINLCLYFLPNSQNKIHIILIFHSKIHNVLSFSDVICINPQSERWGEVIARGQRSSSANRPLRLDDVNNSDSSRVSGVYSTGCLSPRERQICLFPCKLWLFPYKL